MGCNYKTRAKPHNIRTCSFVHKAAETTRDMAFEQAAEFLAEELGEEALAELIETGADFVLPGAGTFAKAIRYACRAIG